MLNRHLPNTGSASLDRVLARFFRSPLKDFGKG